MELLIGKRPSIARLAFPENRRFIFPPSRKMTIETVVADIQFSADKPLSKRRLPHKRFFPGRKPGQKFFGALRPIGLRIFFRLTKKGLIRRKTFDVSLGGKSLGRLKDTF